MSHVLLSEEKQYTFEEILPVYKAISQVTDTGTFADFMEGFKTYDREGQGMMGMAELRNCLNMMGTSFLCEAIRATTMQSS